ncbi:sulfurtransferase [Streptomyces pseudovenezuelae]|uniref:Thiosulfate/3-mercaptopyruvate sulfurtransferase n=1 Tax=Streptomyces pseudovenezuelae TaxID=67350 RepID=A0ABT6L9Q7_9ACTN|nr:rhodanese-like domain-containing protein [Streptomyces pseudovenezuelae]MDH6212725.1 thiosulfate/3-mercaptopyruvate sulfurtransferase [Streptomyces pseudovenezuelae]
MTSLLPGPLVDDAWLADRLDDPRLVVVDATCLLPSPRHDGDYRYVSGREGWAERHLPGSRHADLTGDFSDHDASYHFAVPAPDALAAALARLGVGRGSAVVTYDTGGGIWAARLWWMLRAISVPVAVLDGGLAAWEAAGRPLATGDDTPPVPDVGPVTPDPRPGLWTGIDEVAAISRGERPGTLVCALPTGGYDGSVPTRYSRRGHIPASRSLPGRELLGADARVLPPAELAAKVDAVLDTAESPVVLYCGGGIAAAGAALALTLLGRTDVSLYDGSLEEWSKDPARPVELGG